MCTAISYKSGDVYFGRNLDLERGYNERVVITPRNYTFKMRCTEPIESHYAMIGMAAVVNDYPLYFEATNEAGLSVAGLNFPGNAVYYDYVEGMKNITPYEFIPWVLAKCTTLAEVRSLLDSTNLVKINFSDKLPLSPLHFLISDRAQSIVVESVKEGLKIYDNPFNVLANNPPFDYHLANLNNYMHLNAGPAVSNFHKKYPFHNYSLGMGAIGLPGDFSSASRFVRAFFVKENSVFSDDEMTNVTQFFHIMNSVAMPKGCVQAGDAFEYTRYTSCCNVDRGIYYYNTYDNPEIKSVSMGDVDLEGKELIF